MAKHLDNIVALASAQGKSALALIRLSGNNLNSIYNTLTRKTAIDRRATYCKIYHPNNNSLLDESIITYFKKPHSFTGEDVIEISCHGGTIIANNIIRALISYDARYADPGEFSLRAFYNGKIDLLQAESINQLIKSKSQISTEIGLNHLSGLASNKINTIKIETITLLTIIENELNFSENEINITTTNTIKKKLNKIKKELEIIITSSLFGKEINNGYRVVIIGEPNAGKSSLFNIVLAKDRSIVSNIKGTTRDIIEANIEINGVPVTLIDTAGLWETKNNINKQSVNKTLFEINRAHLVLFLDDKDPKKMLTSKYLEKFQGKYLLVKTKQDDYKYNDTEEVIFTSAKKNRGINNLLTALSTLLTSENEINIGSIFIGTRQRSLLDDGLIIINNVIDQCSRSTSTDIIASTIKSFTLLMEELIGEINDKKIINQIFSTFCIGK